MIQLWHLFHSPTHSISFHQPTMSSVQTSRLFARRFAVAVHIPRRCITTSSVAFRRTLPQPAVASSLRRRLPFQRILSRPFSVSSHSRQEIAAVVPATDSVKVGDPKEETPAYEMTFTCKKCETRSTHRVSKQGYHNGTVLITCPGCKNKHLISDHLKVCWFQCSCSVCERRRK